jgi:hypothetical protein
MKRIIKDKNSKILLDKLSYPKDKVKIKEILEQEQYLLCAYWEDRIVASASIDVEHFNPLLKETDQDGYENWFAACHRANLLKGTKNADSRWLKYQPKLKLTAIDLEEKIVYDVESGDYFGVDEDAQKMVDYLNLNDIKLREDRIDYVESLKDLVVDLGGIDKLAKRLAKFPKEIRFRRVLEIEFNIKYP